MTEQITFEEWKVKVLELLQATYGAISPNFRMIALSHDGEKWILKVFLEKDNSEDREEIADIAFEFEALQSSPLKHAVDIVVGNDPLPFWPPRSSEWIIYRRKEGC